jgi:hypothetical protein
MLFSILIGYRLNRDCVRCSLLSISCTEQSGWNPLQYNFVHVVSVPLIGLTLVYINRPIFIDKICREKYPTNLSRMC